MNDWWKDFRRIVWGVVSLFGLLFLVFVINQFAQLYRLLNQIHPSVAVIATLLLAAGMIYLIIRLIQQFYLAPKTLSVDENASKEEYDDFLADLLLILQKNPNLTDLDLQDQTQPKQARVDLAFQTLKEQSLPLIQQNANAIFMTTAISQNGSLDSLMVLFSLTRMIWQLARIYRTRPSLASFVKLYFQVAGVVLMARTLEDIDLIEGQLEPLISSILGESVASAIPGMIPIANLIVSSLMEGSVNAYLTLRVGLITQTYLTNFEPQQSQTVRRSASVQAMGFMGGIIKQNSKTVIKTMGSAVKKAGVGTAKRWFNFSEK